MPDYTCPKCKKDFTASKASFVKCTHCKNFVKAIEKASAGGQPEVKAVQREPEPPAKVMPDARPEPFVKAPVVLPGKGNLNAAVVPTKKSEIERVAAKKLTTATYFSWCPEAYAKGWIDAAKLGSILAQGRLKQPPPPQGSGLYCVEAPMRSSAWAQKGYICLAIQMVNVPTICKHDKDQMTDLLEGPLHLDEAKLNDNSKDDALFLWTYGGKDGGFSRLTASAGVTITANLLALFSDLQLAEIRGKLFTAAQPVWDAQIAALKDGKDYSV